MQPSLAANSLSFQGSKQIGRIWIYIPHPLLLDVANFIDAQVSLSLGKPQTSHSSEVPLLLDILFHHLLQSLMTNICKTFLMMILNLQRALKLGLINQRKQSTLMHLEIILIAKSFKENKVSLFKDSLKLIL